MNAWEALVCKHNQAMRAETVRVETKARIILVRNRMMARVSEEERESSEK